MLNISLRRKAKQFSQLARESALQRKMGSPQDPVLTSAEELGVTFIGHSSFFLQIGGLSILVDPNYADWLVLLKRVRRPGLRLRDLPAIDLVLVTHAHMDHLHKPSLRRIAYQATRVSGVAPVIVVPHHVSDLVVDLGFSQVIEMEWWEQISVKGSGAPLQLTHVPARHWGARMIHDFHRGYGGYVLDSGAHSLYHAGDTAYFDGFAEIGERLRPEIALMPIGAYSPDSYRNVHASPEDALQGFMDMGSEWFIPMHYGTFRLSREPMHEPIERLLAESERLGVRDKVLVLPEGTTQVFSPSSEQISSPTIS